MNILFFFNFLIIGLWNSSVSCWFCLAAKPLPEEADLSASETDFLSKIYKT